MKFEGRVWKFGDHVDTDAIIPARFLNQSKASILAGYCFADHRPEFATAVKAGDIIVAGANFGCGSSREHAPWSIKEAGISVVIAASFARIFFRNAVNIGLPILESEEAPRLFSEGDLASVDFDTGELLKCGGGGSIFADPLPEFMRKIIWAGGLVNFIKKEGSKGDKTWI